MQPIYVSGTNFLNGLSATLTSPSGATSTISGSAIAVGSATVFQMMVTLAEAGSYSVRVVNASGPASEPWAFTVKAAETATVPSIAGLSPRSPTQSTASQVVFAGGTNFVAGLTVTLTGPGGSTSTIGGSAVLGVNATGFYMTVTLATAGDYSLRVVNPSGQTSAVFAFSVKTGSF